MSTPSPPPYPHISDDEKLVPESPTKSDHSSKPSPPASRTPAFPSREDCWSEEATRTLIDAWGSHYLHLNRGNLRQKHWQEVADAVNAVHASSPKLRRTDVQCKNRIDTTKKKYKIERSKIVQSNGRYVSTWPHFQSLDSLIGDSFSKINSSTISSAANGHSRTLRRRVSPLPELSPSPSPPPLVSPVSNYLEKDLPDYRLPRLPWSVPVGPRSKRSGSGNVAERNFSVMAAAAAEMEAAKDDSDEDNVRVCPRQLRNRKRPAEDEGYKRLAEAISRLGQIYEKVENAKQRQMLELEKQRMQFTTDLEIQRMKVFMESQVQLKKLKRNSEDSSSL